MDFLPLPNTTKIFILSVSASCLSTPLGLCSGFTSHLIMTSSCLSLPPVAICYHLPTTYLPYQTIAPLNYTPVTLMSLLKPHWSFTVPYHSAWDQPPSSHYPRLTGSRQMHIRERHYLPWLVAVFLNEDPNPVSASSLCRQLGS